MRGWWNGRHACLRSRCRKAWRFKSSLAHNWNEVEVLRERAHLLRMQKEHGLEEVVDNFDQRKKLSYDQFFLWVYELEKWNTLVVQPEPNMKYVQIFSGRILFCVPRAGIGHKSLINSRSRPRLAPCVAPAFDYLSKRSHANKNWERKFSVFVCVPRAGIEPYRFSTPCGYFSSLHSKRYPAWASIPLPKIKHQKESGVLFWASGF